MADDREIGSSVFRLSPALTGKRRRSRPPGHCEMLGQPLAKPEKKHIIIAVCLERKFALNHLLNDWDFEEDLADEIVECLWLSVTKSRSGF